MDGDGWIEVNLPWCKQIYKEKPEYPEELVDRLVRKRFGQTAEELEKAFEKKHGKTAWDALQEIRAGIDDSSVRELAGLNKSALDFTDDDLEAYEKALKKKVEEFQSPLMEEIRTLKLMKETISEFERNIPEVVAWTSECEKLTSEERDEEKRVSFHASELRRPGVLIEVRENGGNVRRFLLGNINCLAGVCDDCVAFDNDAIVLRAKVLVDTSRYQLD